MEASRINMNELPNIPKSSISVGFSSAFFMTNFGVAMGSPVDVPSSKDLLGSERALLQFYLRNWTQ